jgi:hypothetical protein
MPLRGLGLGGAARARTGRRCRALGRLCARCGRAGPAVVVSSWWAGDVGGTREVGGSWCLGSCVVDS